MDRNGAAQNLAWRDGFLFVGNHLALDFVNTRPVENRESLELLPDFAALLRWLQAADLLRTREATRLRQQCGESARARRVVELARELRERLRKELLSREQGGEVQQSTVEEINQLLAEHPMRNRLTRDKSRMANKSWFEVRNADDLLAPIASAAADLFANVDRSRVRKCGNCALHFYDTSKKGARRWCSMQLCGNRFKVAAYAARKRENKSKK
jgi:predicted RNA-binding Zn ribbon-like protein